MDNAEARTRVLQLYKAWYRHIPTMVNEFDIPVNVAKSRDLLRDKFRSNAHIKDTRVIDMLVVKVNIFQISNHFYLQLSLYQKPFCQVYNICFRANKIYKKSLKLGLKHLTLCLNILKKL